MKNLSIFIILVYLCFLSACSLNHYPKGDYRCEEGWIQGKFSFESKRVYFESDEGTVYIGGIKYLRDGIFQIEINHRHDDEKQIHAFVWVNQNEKGMTISEVYPDEFMPQCYPSDAD